MKYIILSLTLLSLIQEKATLTTPITHVSTTEYQVTDVSLSRPKTIGTPNGTWGLFITYYDNKDNRFTDIHQNVFHAVTNPNGADQLVIALNKANLNPATGGKSLNCRALEHLIAENKIPASNVNCTPQ